MEDLLSDLQALDPSGVCARTLEECLKLQLERRDILTPVLESIIDNCLEMVAKNQIPAIARKLRLSPLNCGLLSDYQIPESQTGCILQQQGPAPLHHTGCDHCKVQGPF